MNVETQALLLNAVPLFVLSALYLLGAASLAPELWRERRRVGGIELALVLAFPSAAVAGAIFGTLVLTEREPIGGHAWLGFAAILVALVPALVFLGNWRERKLLITGSRRAREAEERETVDARRRELVSTFTTELARADDVESIARMLVGRATGTLGVDFAALSLIEGHEARGVLGILHGGDVPWWPDLRLDLSEPSAIASAASEAAPFAVYDVESSANVNRRIAMAVGAKSGLWVPVVSGERVIGVVAVATTGGQRVFTNDEIALLQELAAESALALERARSSAALGEALRRERLVARIAHKVRSELDLDAVLEVAVTETAAALGVSRCFIRLGEPGQRMPIEAEWTAEGLEPVGGHAERLPASNLAARERRTVAVADVESAPELADPTLGGRETLLELGTRAVLATPILVFGTVIGVFALHRQERRPWTEDEIALAEAVAHESALAIHIARLLDENARRLRQQAAMLQAAQTLTSELRLETVLQRLVDEVPELLRCDAADCYLLDEARGVLRCAAVRGLPRDLLGFEFDSTRGLSGRAIARGRAVIAEDYGGVQDPIPHPAYEVYAAAIVAPVVWGDRIRGVLGVGARGARRFGPDDADLLEAFANLASLALRNAEAFEEHSRQARIQRGFYRIASALTKPLSLASTLDAVAQAASEALGGAFSAVLMPRGGGLELAGSQALPEPVARVLRAGLPAGDTALQTAAAEGRMLASQAVADDERLGADWRSLAAGAGGDSLLAIPVQAAREDDRNGLVLVFFAGGRRFSDDDVELARHLAGATQGALERSALYEEERAARSLAQQLARTGGLLATELDPAAVLDEVVRQAPRLVGVEACAIRALEEDELVVSAFEGPESSPELIGARMPATGLLSGDVVQSRAPVILPDAGGDERLRAADPVLALGYRGYLGVPLTAPEGALHGVLSVYSRRPKNWRRDETEALRALAANASAALSNAELYQRVALEKERSFAILANIADGIVAVDRDGCVVLWNDAAEQITGVPAAEALGRTPLDVLGRRLERGGDTPSGDRLLSILRGGEEVWLSLTEAVMRDPAGAVAGRIYAFRDISADRLVEEMKSDFVSTVSQELRRPLTSIYGFAETLLRRDVLFDEDERRTFLGYIASESERLTGIVDALLNVARLDTGDLKVDLGPTDVGLVVAEVVSGVEESAAVNGHRFVLDLPDEPLAAEADPEKLRQVLSNLIDNAVKYSPGGGTVTVAARRRNATVEVSVADEGVGIPQGERERIFRKFYRADSGSGRGGEGGTGLGLFIVRGLVTAMGGRIWVNSTEGEGSSFTFELPLAWSGKE